MQTTDFDPPISTSSILRRIIINYVGFTLVSFTFSYLYGELRYSSMGVQWHFLNWGAALLTALILDYARRLAIPRRRGWIYKALYLAPGINQISRDAVRWIGVDPRLTFEGIWIILYFLDAALLILGVRLLQSAYTAHVTRSNLSAVESDAHGTSAHDTSHADASSYSLGQGNDYIDRVIHSVLRRSMKSERAASFSLTIMLTLVMIGGMASFGLWVFTHADRVSTLEAERNKLISLQAEMREIRDKLGTGSEELKAQFDRLFKYIEQNYSTSASYEATLNKLSLQSQTNLADIAIRVTIAVLTIFLVQVFFSVYKCNRHLAIMLAAKAEALELAGNNDDARKELSLEAVNIVKESVPGFGSRPRTPIEEAVRAAEKLSKRE